MPSTSMSSVSSFLWTWICLSAVPVSVLSGVPARREKRGQNDNNFYFKPMPQTHEVESGHSVRLRCEVSSNRNIRYHWTHNLQRIISTSRRYEDGSDLYISNVVQELDSGPFNCVATNITTKFSMQSRAYYVVVFQMDPGVSVELVKPAKLSDIYIGGQVELRCKTKAHPRVKGGQISWYHNFQRLKGQSAMEKDTKVLSSGNLLIQAYQAGNAGVYRCQVLHAAGHVMANKSLIITAGDDRLHLSYTFSTDPEKYIHYYRRGEVLKLRCPVTLKNKAAWVKWAYRARLDLNSNVKNFEFPSSCKGGKDGSYCFVNKESLHINPKPGQSWSGFFACRVFANNSFSKEFTIEVRRAENPTLNLTNFGLRHSRDKIVPVAGGKYTIRVYIDLTPSDQQLVADPKPTFQWFLPSGAPAMSTGRIRMIEGYNLHFDNVQRSDSGSYNFTATNKDGRRSMLVKVAVAFPPVMKPEPLKNRELKEEAKNVAIRCNVAEMSEYPIATIEWEKDGIPLGSSKNKRIKTNRRTGVLRFAEVSRKETGTYRCIVRTRYLPPVASEPFEIRVLKMLRIIATDSQPFLERSLPGKLTCMASGVEPITFRWFRKKDGQTIRVQDMENKGRYQVEREAKSGESLKSVMVIQIVKDEDAGEYICQARDNRQTMTNTTYSVVVGEKPTIKFSTKNNISISEGQTFRLQCEASGDPQPKTSWIRRRIGKDAGSESLTLETFAHEDWTTARRYLFENGTLLIRNAMRNDEGVYQCVLGHRHAMVSGPEIHVRVNMLNGDYTRSGDGQYRRRSPLTKTILIVVGCALAYLGLIIALTVYCSLRMMKKRRKYTEAVMVGPGTKADLAAAAAAESQCLMANGGDTTQHGTLSGGQISPSASMYYRPFDAASNVSSVLDPPLPPYPRDRLITMASLGKGEFGEVLLARAPATGGEHGEGEITVTVKKLNFTKDRRIVEDFFAQIEMFNKLDHKSVAKLVGVYLDEEPRCLMLEHCAWGDLKQFLHAIRRGNPSQPLMPSMTTHVGGPDSPTTHSLSYSQRMHICSQVANGMEHISNLRYVHKDLAARNVLLSPNLDVKISHLGLCQSAYAEDYFPLRLVHRSANPNFRNGRMVPLRWMPPEVIINGAYSPETDVWSYGIFVYEVLSLGETPLRKHTHSEIVMAACAHHLLPELPPSCTPELQALLLRCWSEQPSDRPSFSEISVLVGGMVVECDV